MHKMGLFIFICVVVIAVSTFLIGYLSVETFDGHFEDYNVYGGDNEIFDTRKGPAVSVRDRYGGEICSYYLNNTNDPREDVNSYDCDDYGY